MKMSMMSTRALSRYGCANKNASTQDSMLQFLQQDNFLSIDFLSCCQCQLVQNTLCDDADSPFWPLTSPWRGGALCDKVTVSKRTLCSGLPLILLKNTSAEY